MRSEGVAPINPAWGSRLVGIEGLRAIACLLVLVDHVWQFNPTSPTLGFAGPWVIPNTPSGLTLFFVLSGFLLYRPFAAAIIGGFKRPSTSAYLRNRALRIMPGYVVIFLIVSLVLNAAVTNPMFFVEHNFSQVGGLHSPGLFIQNLFLLQGFTPSGLASGIGTAWSLGAELVFYLVLPLLALSAERLARGLRRRDRTLATLAPATVLLTIGVVSKVIAADTSHGVTASWGGAGTWHAVFERSFLASADLFSFGMVAAVIVISADAGRLPRWKASYAGAGALLTGVIFSVLNSKQYIGARADTTAMALAFGLLVLYVALPRDPSRPGMTRVLETRVMVYLGVISYSVYLWHEPLILFLHKHGLLAHGKTSFILNVLSVFTVTAGLSAVTYHLVEARAMRHKVPMTSRQAHVADVIETDAVELAP